MSNGLSTRLCSASVALSVGLVSLPVLLATPAIAVQANLQPSIQALNDKGTYWYERYRFDLAVQSFNKILLLDPSNASALRWQGLIDLARGDIKAANVWLGKLQVTHGNHPFAIELEQSIALAGEKRQQLTELRQLADRDEIPEDLPQRLRQLLPQAPLGQAAIQIYGLMSRTSQGREHATKQIAELTKRYPEDPRYARLLRELGGSKVTTAKKEPTPKSAQKAAPKTKPEPIIQPSQQAVSTEITTETPAISGFEQGQQRSEKAQLLIQQGNVAQAIELLQEAVELNPAYPWFRFDLAMLLNEQGDAENRLAAEKLMGEGMAKDPSVEMRFASALLAARQNRNTDALALIKVVPKKDWTEGMSALEKRIQYGQHLDALRALEQSGQYNQMASVVGSNTQWRAEPEVREIERNLQRRRQTRVHMAYENAVIDGDAGVSRIETNEIPLQIDIPLNFEKTIFVRADTLNVKSGRVNLATASNFAKLGTTTAGDPAISSGRLDQNYRGYLLGIGIQTDSYRIDLGTTAGNYPVHDWVGGVQWRTQLKEGSLQLEVARRMVNGSVLSTTGAVDPLTGETWGGARRNGINAVYYQALNPTLDFVGIARANVITGKNIPDNTELNLQGNIGKTVYQSGGHEVEVGASLFLWSFEKNMRFYTFGQGGYYSPQSFVSLTFPVTWSGKLNDWSWQLQARLGVSESQEDDTPLYPLGSELAAAATTQGNPTLQRGETGGSISHGLRLAIEKQVLKNMLIGGHVEIDRTEGYNPDRLQVYLKYSFDDFIEFSSAPQGVLPYSRF